MWASNNSSAATVAELAGEDAMGEIFREKKIHVASPSACGRIAMAVYHAVLSNGSEVNQAWYFADWWANDGGDLEVVPDGTPPDH